MTETFIVCPDQRRPWHAGHPHSELTDNQVNSLGLFWKNIWEVPAEHRPDHPALEEWRAAVREQSKASPEDTPVGWDEAWGIALAKMSGWKAPGPDGIEAFWWKSLKGPAGVLKEMLWEMTRGEREFPEWLVRGRTIIIPKSGCTGEPHQFR